MTEKLRIVEERVLSQSEITLLEWLLANGRPDASKYRPQIVKLRVISRCGCGCPTIDFAIGATLRTGPSYIVAEAEGTSEGVLVGVIVHIREEEISELEVYDVAGGNKPFGLPPPETLVACPA